MGDVEGIVGGLRALVRTIDASPYAGEMYGARALETIAHDTPIFARDAPGALLEAVNESATRLLDSPTGARLRRVLDTAAALADERPDSKFRGIVLASDADAAAGWARISALRTEAPLDPAAPPFAQASDYLTEAQTTFAGAAAYFGHDGMIVPATSGPGTGGYLAIAGDVADRPPHVTLDEVVARFTDATLTQVDQARLLEAVRPTDNAMRRGFSDVLHELEHADGVVYRGDDAVARALEEGSTDTIAHWPGRLDSFLERAGVTDEVMGAAKDESMRGYPSEVDGMRGYLRLAGVDPNLPADLPRAFALLRGRQESGQVLDNLAGAIAAYSGNGGDEHVRAVRTILAGEPASLDAVSRVEAALLGAVEAPSQPALAAAAPTA